jgi:hypothetical protein
MLRRVDGRGVGGFYESIMAMMVVTVGVLILTASLTFMSARQESEAPDLLCDRVVERLLNDEVIQISDRLLDASGLAHWNLSSDPYLAGKGIKVMLAYGDGLVDVLFQQGEWDGSDRVSRSEAVNVFFNHADVRPALLIVWVWS